MNPGRLRSQRIFIFEFDNNLLGSGYIFILVMELELAKTVGQKDQQNYQQNQQRKLFYLTVPGLLKDNEVFNYRQHFTFPEGHQHQLEQLQHRARKYAKNLGQSRQKTIEALLLYSSGIRCYSHQKIPISVYEMINNFLRQASIQSLTTAKFIKEPSYFYICVLLRQIKRLPRCKQNLVYRGVSYEPYFQAGKTVTFKSFTSTSISRKFAQKFAKMGVLLQINIHTGYLNTFSQYKEEQQVFLLPFSKFRVDAIRSQCTTFIDIDKTGLKIYVLSQIKNETTEGYNQLYGQKLVVENICSELSYFFLCLENQEQDSYKEPKYHTITYRGDNTKIYQIIDDIAPIREKFETARLMEKDFSTKQKFEDFFVLSNGFRLNNYMPIALLKKMLLRNNIDGLVLFPGKKSTYLIDQPYQNQVQISQNMPIHKYPNQIDYKFFLKFNVPSKDYNFVVQVKVTDTLQATFKLFYQWAENAYNVKLSNEQIDSIKIKSLDNEFNEIDSELLKQQLRNIDLIYNNVTIYIELKQKEEFKQQIKLDNQRIVIYYENSDQFTEILFQEVKFFTFKAIYETKLKRQQQQQQPKYVEDNMKCLKVMDIILKQNQTFEKLSLYFYNGKHSTLVGRVISEKVIFYKHLREVTQSSAFQEYILDNLYPVNKNCEKNLFINKIREKIRERVIKTNSNYFKKAQNLQPIYVYTADDIYIQIQNIDQEGNTVQGFQKFYVVIKKYLRQIPAIASSVQKLRQNWKFLFTCKLQQKLEHIQNFKRHLTQTKVYRGVEYDFKGYIGEVVTFKSFLSTSTKQNATYPFLFKSNGPDRTLLEMKIIVGKPVKEFSAFQQEEQVLLLPYSQFRIISRQQQVINGKKVTRVKLQELSQQQSPTTYSNPCYNVLIWVDDKVNEGRNIYKTANYFKETTYFIEITSNQQLKDWLSQLENILLIKNAENVALVSNMKRGDNPIAGIVGLIEFQKYQRHHQIPVFFYVNNIDRTKKHLKDHKNRLKNFKNIGFGRTKIELQQFLKKALKFYTQSKGNCQFM